MSVPTKVVVAVTYNPEHDSFLLLKRSNDRGDFPGRWEFPSGELESDEVRDEALRELNEETRIIGETVKAGEEFLVESKYGDFDVYPVLVLADKVKPELTREHSDFGWFGIEEIRELETVKDLEKDLENVGVLDE